MTNLRPTQHRDPLINGWKTILNALTIHYGDRIEAAH